MRALPLQSTRPDVLSGCYWFTGLSGAGKTTLASAFRDALRERASLCMVLDGDELRKGLNSDLGFSREDRRENVRRIAELASILVDAGFVVLVAAIAPYSEDRLAVSKLFFGRAYAEVYVATDQATCVARDPKGLYQRALQGKLSGMTGLHSPYEPPLAPDLRIDTSALNVAQCVAMLLAHELGVSSLSACRHHAAVED